MDRLDTDERSVMAALQANGNIKDLGSEIRRISDLFSQAREEVLVVYGQDAQAATEFETEIWWKPDD